MNHVMQFPSPDTLAEVRSYADGTEPELPSGWVAMTEAETRAWVEEQKAAGWVPIRPLSDAELWQQKLDGGWTDTGEGNTGIKLKTTEAARNLFSGQVGLLREGLEAGTFTPDMQQPIWDYDEQLHLLTVTQLRGLLLRYGIAWAQMFAEFAP